MVPASHRLFAEIERLGPFQTCEMRFYESWIVGRRYLIWSTRPSPSSRDAFFERYHSDNVKIYFR